MTDAQKRLTWFAVPTLFSSHTPKVKQVPKPFSEPSPTLPEVKLEVNPSLHLPTTAPVPTSEPIPAAAPSNHNAGAHAKLRSVIEHNYSDTSHTTASTENTCKDRLLNCVVSVSTISAFMTCHPQLVVNFVMSSSEVVCHVCLPTVRHRKFTGLVPLYLGTFEHIIYTIYSKTIKWTSDNKWMFSYCYSYTYKPVEMCFMT